MPYKVSGGKWKWGNIERKSKEDLRKVVYGIWMKGGSKGSFSKFWKTGKVYEDEDEDASNSLDAMFYEAVKDYRDKLGIDLSYMALKVSKQPVYTNGKPCFKLKPEECAGDWTKLGWIRLNPDMKSVMDYYGVDDMDADSFAKTIIRHELAHEIWNTRGNDKLKKTVLDAAKSKKFSTKYLETVKDSKLAEETFCEYLAASLDSMPDKF